MPIVSPAQPIPVTPVPVAPPAKIAGPNIAGGIGAFIVILGMGWQAFSQQDSADAAAIQGLTGLDLAKLAGVLIMAGGFVAHSNQAKANERDSQASITAASIAAPVNAEGEQHSSVTLAAGVEQLANEGQHDVAIRVLEAMKGAVKP